jgi:rod shape-determining protein MreB and related proteins
MPIVEELGIDLGTVNVLVYVRGRGIVLQEPSVVAQQMDTGEVVAVGEEARAMMGRAPETIVVRRPLRAGVIADYRVTREMLFYFMNRAIGKRFRLFKPKVCVTVPFGATQVERRAVQEAALEAGASQAYRIPEPIAGAIGAGLPIHTPGGHMVVDLGGGASQAAVLSVYGVVTSAAIREGGVHMDEAIANYVRRKYNLMIGQSSAEEAKIRIGAALGLESTLRMEVQGRDQVTGLPRAVEISSDDIIEALEEPITLVINMVKSVLEHTPPELASDIIDRGMTMIGGGSLLRNLDQLLTQETGVPVYVADAPMACVAVGAGKSHALLPYLRRTLRDL